MSECQLFNDSLNPVPPELAAADHFFYRTTAPSLARADTRAIVQAIKSSKRRPTAYRIELFDKDAPEFAQRESRARVPPPGGRRSTAHTEQGTGGPGGV